MGGGGVEVRKGWAEEGKNKNMERLTQPQSWKKKSVWGKA